MVRPLVEIADKTLISFFNGGSDVLRKKIIIFVMTALITIPNFVLSQPSKANNITEFTGYWQHRIDLFRTLPNPEGEICFLGDSITDGCEWAELTGNLKCTNRGISSDTSWGIMKRLDEVTEGKPAKIFLMIGTNELDRNKNVAQVREQIGKVLDVIKAQTPKTEVYLQSVLPVVDYSWGSRNNKTIDAMNVELEKLAAEKNVTWVNLAPFFKDEKGALRTDLSFEGLHLNGRAYYLWYSIIRKYLP